MASISFVDYSTVIPASWLNDVNTLTYNVWNGVSTIGQARNALGLGSDVTKTLSLAGNLTTSGAYDLTLTLTGATNVTLPTTGTVATTSNKLSAFAATTSAELAGVISDETGSGALVFANTPTLVTPNIGTATGTSLTTTGVQASGDGTVSAPGMAFGSDLNNGFYRIGTDNWAAVAAGVKVMEFNPSGEITMPLQPAFSAYNTTTRTNKTGNGSSQVVDFDAEIFDQGSDFNTGTSVFTAPVTGRYHLYARILVVSLSASANDFVTQLVTSNRTYSTEALVSSGSPLSGLQSYTVEINQLCDMDAGDTAYVQVTVYGMAGNTAGFYGNATGYYTAFSGYLAC